MNTLERTASPAATGAPRDPEPPTIPSVAGTARRTSRRLPRRLLGLLAGVGAVGAALYFGRESLWATASTAEEPLTGVARRSTLRVVVTERGNLESTVTVDGVCELNGFQNKIIELVAEGTKVEKAQIVC